MNQIATRERQPVAAPKSQHTPRQIATMALSAEDGTLAFLRARTEASSLFREARNPPEGVQDRLAWSNQRLPPLPALLALLEDAKAAARRDRPDPSKNRVFVSLMVESYPTARASDQGPAIEALLHDLQDSGYSSEAVALGLRDIRRSSKFLPSIAEALEAVSKAAGSLLTGVSVVELMIDERRQIDRAMQCRLRSESV